jgi:hypothetical protein
MSNTTSNNKQRRIDRGLQSMPRPDSTAALRKDRARFVKKAKKEAKKGPMQQLKETWDD